MYKSQLQELCQRNKWRLPEYETIRDGPPHQPRFQTTVTVTGCSFTPHHPSKTSKESQNEAAQLALLHIASSSSSSGSSSSSTVQLNIQETNQAPEVNTTNTVVKDADRSKAREALFMPNLYKNQLQSYAHKRNLALPIYSCEREGPPHASRFRCKVTIGEQTYECPTFFSTLKDAEHGAAKVALMSLPSEAAQEVDSVLYKNLLQEFTQKKYHALPMYKTNQSGEPHMPTFVSTVELEGEVFTGQESKTKKQAEISAAKVAYLTLKEGKTSHGQGPKSLSPACGAQADHQSSCLQSNVTTSPHQDIQPTVPMVFNPKSWEEADNDEVNEEFEEHLNLFPQPEINPTWKRESSPTVVSPLSPAVISLMSPTALSTTSVPANPPASLSLPSDAYGGRTDSDSRPKIRVLPHTPNMKLPKDCKVVRTDERYVALRLRSQSNQ